MGYRQVSDDLVRLGEMLSPWDDWVSPDGTSLLPEVRIAIWYIAFRGYELLHNGQLVDRNRRPAVGRPAPEAMNAIKLQTEFLLDPRVRTLTHPVRELKITSANLKRGYRRRPRRRRCGSIRGQPPMAARRASMIAL